MIYCCGFVIASLVFRLVGLVSVVCLLLILVLVIVGLFGWFGELLFCGMSASCLVGSDSDDVLMFGCVVVVITWLICLGYCCVSGAL